jgi:hypothetical protein
MASIWRERALRHYDEVNVLIARVLDLEGRQNDGERFREVLAEVEKAAAEPKATSAAA